MAAVTVNEDSRAKINKVAETIEGTCRSLDDVVQEVFEDPELEFTDLPQELLEALDDMTMQCEGCGWWCETGDLDDDQVCGDCR